jgi:hypothetical protein
MVASVKLGVRETGMCRLTGRELAAAGVPLADVTVDRLSLSTNGAQVAFRITGAAGTRLTDASEIVFYGEALDTKYTDTNVYWLSWDGEPGPRMTPMDSGAQAGPELPSFRCRLHVEENHEYAYLIWVPEEGELDPWFWTTARPGKPAKVSADLPGLAQGGADVRVSVALRGRTSRAGMDPDHHVRVQVNGQPLGEASFDAQAETVVQGAMPAGAVRSERNEIAVTCPGDTKLGAEDEVFLDWVEIEYDRGYRAYRDRLTFQAPAGARGRARVTGLSADAADVYEVRSCQDVRFSADLPVQGGELDLPVAGGADVAYHVVTREGYLPPAFIAQASSVDLRSPENQADLVIIAFDDFCEALAPLVEYRKGQGLHVSVVPVSAVYDEFGDGVVTPVAIRDFLRHAYAHWARPAPRYVLLVGDASYDYRNYLRTGERNYVPTYPVRVRNSIETPTDAFYVCVEGDDHIPEMLIGRLPARSREEVARFCERIVSYETAAPGGDWRRRALLVADHELTTQDPTWFERSTEAEAQQCEASGMHVERVYLRRSGVKPELPADENVKLVRKQATPGVLDALGEGCALFLFQGHGAGTYLSRQRVLETGDVAEIDNHGRSPLGVLVTCFAGAFDDPQLEGGKCLAERLLDAPSGLIACIGPTRLGGPNIEMPLLQRLLAAPNTPIGEAFVAAKQNLLGRRQRQWELADNYNLLGDPLLVLPLEARAPQIAAAAEGSPAEDVVADENGNRIADVLEKHVAAGVYQRYGTPDQRLIAIFCRMAGPPSAEDVAEVERLEGRVLDIEGPPWGVEVVLPTGNVTALADALADRLAMIHESARYGRRAEIIRVPEKQVGGDAP